MENKIDIAKILEDCPKGTKLYSPLCGECTLEHVHSELKKIIILTSDYRTLSFHSDGRYIQMDNAECLLFPSKENRDWSKFQRLFIDGDILTTNLGTIFIYKETKNTVEALGCYFAIGYWGDIVFETETFACKNACRLATPKEKEKLFDAINDKGYLWNDEAKTLEKLVESKEDTDDRVVMSGIYFDRENYADEVELHLGNYEIEIRNGNTYAIFKNKKTETLKRKFKVGDRVRLKLKPNYVYTIHSLAWDDNKRLAYRLLNNNDKHLILVSLNAQDNYELVPNKFDINTLKPFDKVLVRDSDKKYWSINFFGFYNEITEQFHCVGNTEIGWDECIPYEGNEHLRGTTDDCDEFYKIWE